MRVLVLARPKHFVPPEQLSTLIQAFADWRERYRSQMEGFEFFAGGGGGFAVLNVSDEATLHQIVLEYPFNVFNDLEARPILDGDTALRQWQDALQSMAGGT